MQILDGIEATIVLRKRCPHQPNIVAMKANALSEDRLKYIDTGMDNYISKPFKTEDLVVFLKEIADNSSKVKGFQCWISNNDPFFC